MWCCISQIIARKTSSCMWSLFVCRILHDLAVQFGLPGPPPHPPGKSTTTTKKMTGGRCGRGHGVVKHIEQERAREEDWVDGMEAKNRSNQVSKCSLWVRRLLPLPLPSSTKRSGDGCVRVDRYIDTHIHGGNRGCWWYDQNMQILRYIDNALFDLGKDLNSIPYLLGSEGCPVGAQIEQF